MPQGTVAGAVFLALEKAVRNQVPMVPRSSSDKEYFAQDWFETRLKEAGLAFEAPGRNNYPDYWVTREPVTEGFEVKSLSFKGARPARKDLDFNSTIPSGRKEGKDIFLVFFLYTGEGASPRPVHTISVVHGDLINADHGVADDHLNVNIPHFGSYADGFIRNRKMYVFPTPVTLDPPSLGRCSLIVPASWGDIHPQLAQVRSISRQIAPLTVESYTIRLRGRTQAVVENGPSQHGHDALNFNVFEVKP